jgi:hypothetical protein
LRRTFELIEITKIFQPELKIGGNSSGSYDYSFRELNIQNIGTIYGQIKSVIPINSNQIKCTFDSFDKINFKNYLLTI